MLAWILARILARILAWNLARILARILARGLGILVCDIHLKIRISKFDPLATEDVNQNNTMLVSRGDIVKHDRN